LPLIFKILLAVICSSKIYRDMIEIRIVVYRHNFDVI